MSNNTSKRYRLLKDWPDAFNGDIYQWNGQGYSNLTRTSRVISKNYVEEYDDWFQLLEPERITVSVTPGNYGSYILLSTQPIPEDKFPAIKRAIEKILKGEECSSRGEKIFIESHIYDVLIKRPTPEQVDILVGEAERIGFTAARLTTDGFPLSSCSFRSKAGYSNATHKTYQDYLNSKSINK